MSPKVSAKAIVLWIVRAEIISVYPFGFLFYLICTLRTRLWGCLGDGGLNHGAICHTTTLTLASVIVNAFNRQLSEVTKAYETITGELHKLGSDVQFETVSWPRSFAAGWQKGVGGQLVSSCYNNNLLCFSCNKMPVVLAGWIGKMISSFPGIMSESCKCFLIWLSLGFLLEVAGFSQVLMHHGAALEWISGKTSGMRYRLSWHVNEWVEKRRTERIYRFAATSSSEKKKKRDPTMHCFYS